MKRWNVEKVRGYTRGDVLVALSVAIAALLLFFLSHQKNPGAAGRLEIRQDGKLVASYALHSLNETIRIPISAKYPLEIECSPLHTPRGEHSIGVRVVSASCPGLDCMRGGTISHGGEHIVCLPNRLVITLISQDELPFDCVAG